MHLIEEVRRRVRRAVGPTREVDIGTVGTGYPLASTAVWSSEPFTLEPLPELPGVEDRLIAKAAAYFDELWSSATAS